MNPNLELQERLLTCLREGRPVATVTIVASTGSIPNEVGAKMLVDATGQRLAGTVGGGEVERIGIEQARLAIAEGRSRQHAYNLTEKHAHGIGMMCGGTAHLFIEVLLAPTRLILVGAGHVNIEVAHFAQRLGLRTIVIDDRPEWANAEHYPASHLILARPAAGMPQVDWQERDYLVVATADADTESLRTAIALPCQYVGLVASKRKTIQILKNLQAEGHDLSGLIPRLRSPVGLDLGGKSPAEVALSIISEIQAHRSGRVAQPLSYAQQAYALSHSL